MTKKQLKGALVAALAALDAERKRRKEEERRAGRYWDEVARARRETATGAEEGGLDG